MRIGIDVQPLQTGTRHAGIGCYLRNVLQHLSYADPENEYVLLLNNSNYLEDVNTPSPVWKKYHLTRKHRLGRFWWWWDTVYLPTVLFKENIDIYHYNSLSEVEHMAAPFPFGKHRVVTTIFDLVPLKLPPQATQLFLSSKRDFDYSAKLRRLQYANAIITISECSKQDIVTLLNYPKEKVFIAYCGISPLFTHVCNTEQLKHFQVKYNIPDFSLLYVGGYYSERKNLARLLDAYKLLLHTTLSPKPILVLAGLSNPVHKKAMESLIYDKKISQHVLCLPYIPDEELPLLYHSATLFVYPSLYEGFGLPVAEAMACGTVAAISNTSSLPEIGGDACLYFDPYNSESIAETVYKGLTNMTLRKELQRKGPKQAELFSWEQSVQTILSVYEYVCST